MGLLQAAYRTYETQAHRAGIAEEGKEPLTPVAHILQNAQIEISLSSGGVFQSARTVPKEDNKTLIPATVESANRVSKTIRPHPLCDQLRFLAPFGEDRFAAYLTQLERWANSEFSHPKVRAILRYIQSGAILDDLAASGIITLDENGLPGDGKIEAAEYAKCMIRWRILSAPEGALEESWRDTTLFSCYTAFYKKQCERMERGLCSITGEQDILCEIHPKGVVSANFGAKLISANDSSGFTYRGRFTQSGEASSVGYFASQKAHNALRWVAANSGVLFGGRTFLCWNPEGSPVPAFAFFGLPAGEPLDFVSYQGELLKTLGGYGQKLKPQDDVIIAALDAATTGRLSVTYYNELKGSDFLNRLEQWFTSCCWDSRSYGVQSPPLRRIVSCAFGTERAQYIEADDRVLREHVQQMLHCIIDRKPVPQDIVRALATRAGMPLAYSAGNREILLATACALVRKYRNDKAKKEEWTLALDTTNTDRSYLFGRLLAVAERAERRTYDREEGREPNAIRMQAVFAQRPLYAWRIICEQLNPYFARMAPGLRAYFKKLIGEITDLLPTDVSALGQRLDDTYLLGYYHQLTAMTRKKETSETEEEKQ